MTPRFKLLKGGSGRHGVAIISVVVLFSISVTLFGVWAQMAIREHRRLESQHKQLQSLRLAEAGLRRAVARRAADPQYNAETWSVPAEQLGGAHAAEVRIRISQTADASALHYEATATFPVDAHRRAQVTKRIDIPAPTSEDES
jgi:hypothetical protein